MEVVKADLMEVSKRVIQLIPPIAMDVMYIFFPSCVVLMEEMLLLAEHKKKNPVKNPVAVP